MKFTLVKPHNLFLALGLVLGLGFLVVTPPFEVPDEPNHFFRTWQLAGFQVAPLAQGGSFGGRIPISLIETYDAFVNIGPTLPGKLDVSHLFQFLRAPLNPEKERYIGFTNTVVYAPTSYIPQALGVFLVKLADGSPLALVYAGRLFSLIAYLGLLYWAIRVTPVIPWLFCLAGLSPMALAIAASFSADNMTNAFAFVLIALLFRQIMLPEVPLRKIDLTWITLFGLLLSLSKIVYFPIVFLLFLIPFQKLGSRARAVLISAAICGFCMLTNYLWTARVKGYYLPMFAGVDFDAQTRLVLNNPLEFARTMLRTYFVVYPAKYLVECYGKMGHLAIPMPGELTTLYYLLLAGIVVAGVERGVQMNLWRRVAAGLIAISVIALIALALYITCTAVGLPRIEGIQGRYFIPILPLLFVLLLSRRDSRFKWMNESAIQRTVPFIVTGFSILSAAVALYRVCVFFY